MTKAKSATALKMSPVKARTLTRIPNPYSSSPKKNAEEKKNSHNIIPLVDNNGTPYGWAFDFFLMPRILSKTFQTGTMH
jgi:hypothetical protein